MVGEVLYLFEKKKVIVIPKIHVNRYLFRNVFTLSFDKERKMLKKQNPTTRKKGLEKKGESKIRIYAVLLSHCAVYTKQIDVTDFLINEAVVSCKLLVFVFVCK